MLRVGAEKELAVKLNPNHRNHEVNFCTMNWVTEFKITSSESVEKNQHKKMLQCFQKDDQKLQLNKDREVWKCTFPTVLWHSVKQE